MTFFLQVRQVKSYPGLLTQVPLLCECAQRAVTTSATWQHDKSPERMFCSWVSLCPACVPALCVWSRCQWLTVDTRQQMTVPDVTFSSTLPLLLNQHLWCCHFMLTFHVFALPPCCALLFLHSNFFLKEHWSFSGQVEAAYFLLHVQYFGHSPFLAR